MDIIIKVMYLLLWAEHSQCGKSFRVWTVASLQLKKEANRGISYEKKGAFDLWRMQRDNC